MWMFLVVVMDQVQMSPRYSLFLVVVTDEVQMSHPWNS